MEIKSVSGMGYPVKDLNMTVDFYKSLGFREGKKDDHSVSVYMNWFWIEFFCNDDSTLAEQNRSSTQDVLMYLSVDDLATTYQELQERGLNPSPEVINKFRGRRESRISDPDGYTLAFFQKK